MKTDIRGDSKGKKWDRMKLGQIRFAAQICPDTRGIHLSYEIFIRRYTCVRFKKRGRVGWRWDAFEQVSFPNYPSRLEALRAARRHIKQLYGRLLAEQRP
jgi:hypothetical protein